MAEKKKRVKIPKVSKVRAELQKEIGSKCPFCENEDVGHFEIHHIDENPSNNAKENLLLLCSICHSKITKEDIIRKEVDEVKFSLISRQIIECAKISVDSINCSWDSYDNVENSFVNKRNNKPEFPILNFSLINHTSKTILFQEIKLKVKHLYNGLSGISKAQILKPIAKFKIQIPEDINEIRIFTLTDEIMVPSGQAFKFQVQLFEQLDDNIFTIIGRKVLYFTFGFNNKLLLTAPTVFLNCKSETEEIKLGILS